MKYNSNSQYNQKGKKKILFIIERYSKYYTDLAYSYTRAFNKIGYDCKITAFNVNLKIYGAIKHFPYLKKRYLSKGQNRVLSNIKNCDADLVFVIKGTYLNPEALLKVKECGKFVLCFNPDNPFSSIAGSSNDNIRQCMNYYDVYFIWHKQLIQKIKEAGCKHVFYLPFAADTEIIIAPTNNIIDKSYAVSFVGNADNERKSFVIRLSEILKGWNEPKALFGYDWNKIEGFKSMGIVLGKDYLNTMYNTKINLNILRKQNKNSHNMRTFEIPAAGGFMLHEYSDEVADFFKEGAEAEFFRDAVECADKIKYYFKNDNLRNKIAKAGYEKIFSAGYTYLNLVTVIEEKINGII